MSEDRLKNLILEAWKDHSSSIRAKAGDGPLINTIDDSRLNAIEVVKIIMHNFLKGDFDLQEFKIALDSYNKHNNLWGFTAKLGQMYFNQIIKSNEGSLAKLSEMLKDLITEPKNLKDALNRIDTLETFTQSIYSKSKDKHSAPYPGAVGYFLSYFWQIYNHKKWPILYNTLVNAFRELGMWDEKKTQKETYEAYYHCYNELVKVIEEHEDRRVGYWEIEHAFWNYKPKPVPAQNSENELTTEVRAQFRPEPILIADKKVEVQSATRQRVQVAAQMDTGNVREYLIPRLNPLLDGFEEGSDAHYGELITEVFAQMGFQTEMCTQDAMRDAMAIVRLREENIAFVLDACSDSEVFFKENDRRMVKEYINDKISLLRREGYKKICYLLVAPGFRETDSEFSSYIEWNTEIRKTTLISTNALLYLMAYKFRNRTALYELMEKMARFPQLVQENIAEELSA
jgi:hypothetical protein